MAGDAETGVTILRVIEELDSGPIALQRSLAIGDDDYGALAARLAKVGGELMVEALDLRAAGELELREQDDALATYAAKIDPAERRLDPARPALELERLVRALTPHVSTYLELEGGDRLGVLEAAAEPGELAQGAIATDHGLRLGCAEGVLRLLRVRPAGGREMDAAAYLRGHPAAAPGVSSATELTPARRAAYEVVRRTFDDGAWTDRAFTATAARAGLEGRELALARRLAYGAVQRRGTSDHLIAELARRRRVDAAALAALRLGLYELMFSDHPADHAAVDQAVELAKAGALGDGAPRGPRARGIGLRERCASPGGRRARAAARAPRRLDAGGSGDRALVPRVAGADVVGGARRSRGGAADGRDERASRGGVSRQHPPSDARRAGGRAARRGAGGLGSRFGPAARSGGRDRRRRGRRCRRRAGRHRRADPAVARVAGRRRAARPAPGRARARPLRRSGDQDDRHRGPDGEPRRAGLVRGRRAQSGGGGRALRPRRCRLRAGRGRRRGRGRPRLWLRSDPLGPALHRSRNVGVAARRPLAQVAGDARAARGAAAAAARPRGAGAASRWRRSSIRPARSPSARTRPWRRPPPTTPRS